MATRQRRSDRPESVRASIARANAHNASARVRQFTDSELGEWLDSLPKAKAKVMPESIANGDARERREWCERAGIVPVSVYGEGYCERRAGMPTGTDSWRPDNALGVRLASIAGWNPARFSIVRVAPAGAQTRIARALNWASGLPANITESECDWVYIARVAPPAPKKKGAKK